MLKTLLMALLLIASAAMADESTSSDFHLLDLFKVEDLSISYRHFFPQAYAPVVFTEPTPAFTVNSPSGPIQIPAQSVSFNGPVIQNIFDSQINLKVGIYKYFYYKSKLDLLETSMAFQGTTTSAVMPKMSNSIGAEWKIFNVEYTKSAYLVSNPILNTFFPAEDSIMLRLVLIGSKK